MNSGDHPWGPRFKRVRVENDAGAVSRPLDLSHRPADAFALRQDFAAKVIRRLINSIRVAVINEHGRPALVCCNEQLYDLLCKDHPIVGVYAAGARMHEVIDDLKAAGL